MEGQVRKPQQESGWNRVLGPFYSVAAVEAEGLQEQAIGFRVGDGSFIYPHRQFSVDENGKISLRQQVVEVWNEVVKPYIDAGLVDVWTASGVMFQKRNEDHVPLADQVADHWHASEELDRIKEELVINISGWSH